jgi:threonyl-tRNA synthetase
MENDEKLHNIRHSLSHLMTMAVLEIYPNTGLGVGMPVDDGFYQDYDLPEKISDDILPKLEKRMRELIKEKIKFMQVNVSFEEAFKFYKNDPYKTEFIQNVIDKGEKMASFYDSGNFHNLCKGPHVKDTSEINQNAFKLDRIAGAYWRGDEKNKMLTRIYGLAFNTKEELENYKKKIEDAKNRDHKKLGKELDLFLIDEEVGKGLPMWTPKGTIIKFALEEYTKDLERKYGYEHVSTPYLGSEKLYKTSGHLEHYSKNMYAPIDMDGDIFYLRPMACPHHIRMLLRKPLSYRDLPVRYAEIADYNRYEKSGELMGMIRLRKFQLTDAHLFVTPESLKEEFKNVCRLIQEGMKDLGLSDSISYRFSRRDPNNKEKYFPDDSLWEKAESVMKEALDEIDLKYTEAKDEAAFYGPKLDVQAENANGKEDTLFTAQIDFLLPQKFDINYTAEDGTQKRVVMIHRSAIGALERTFAFLIERYAGAFPLWLSPVQVIVLPISEHQKEYADGVYKTLKESGIRVELDDSNESLGKRIRGAKMQKVPYVIVIGDKEKDAKVITVEGRKEKLEGITIEQFLEKLKREIAEKTLN